MVLSGREASPDFCSQEHQRAWHAARSADANDDVNPHARTDEGWRLGLHKAPTGGLWGLAKVAAPPRTCR